ncbi:NAD(P)/FAD-dependent oxidoreductase [Lusitaniella coriacea]|uniref:NAD(P)/FAD-dependent oxidoreductase n=1 Tax=Lusitaniella coriacea TaxID=1983105 RepID=UPI003CF5A76F
MLRITIIGCGVVGAAIAYELSSIPGVKITLLDRETPASGSTRAALGVLMGGISRKRKGRAWRLRESSLQRYETLIPELESLTGQSIAFNRQGILRLCFQGEDFESWNPLIKLRHSQGFPLEIWDIQELKKRCPHLENEAIIGAIYSSRDRQVNPTQLTQALVAGARANGVDCQFGANIQNIETIELPDAHRVRCCETPKGTLETDWLVIAAGLGSTPLTTHLKRPLDLRPVLGQALHLQVKMPLGHEEFQPVITGEDVNIVPLGEKNYWVGATVEFPNEFGEVVANPTQLEQMREKVISFCPPLADATILRTWLGQRPRPEGRPAPIIEPLSGYSNVLLATGHYRNGILLAPATAQLIRNLILETL